MLRQAIFFKTKKNEQMNVVHVLIVIGVTAGGNFCSCSDGFRWIEHPEHFLHGYKTILVQFANVYNCRAYVVLLMCGCGAICTHGGLWRREGQGLAALVEKVFIAQL